MTKTRQIVAWTALVAAVVVALTALTGAYGYRWHWWGLTTGFNVVTWAVSAGIGIAAAAALIVILPPYRRPWLPRIAALVAVAICVCAAVPGWIEQRTPRVAALLYDISSDVGNPPVFMDLVAVRGDVTNPPDYPGAEFARTQQRYYPDIKPVRLSMPPDQAFVKAQATAKAMGWEIVSAVPDQGRIEAVAETRWFGIKDDVVIRVSWIDTGSRVDIRSKSRIARNDRGGDKGENARRVRAFLKRIAG